MINKYIDLHFHLDGSITKDIAMALAKMQNISLPDDLDSLLTVSDNCKSLNEFLKCFDLPLSLLQTKDAISEAVFLQCEKMKSLGVIYAEIRYAPQLHTKKGLTQEDSIIAALDGLKRSSLKANLILCALRGDNNLKENYETLSLASSYLVSDGGVVALDLAGAEALFKTGMYKEFFEKAKALNIPFTIHAGEADGAQSVLDAINFGAKRIGHGVRIFEDKKVMDLVLDKGIHLEMCPTSNKLTKAVKDMSDYPLLDYLNKGMLVTINTDDTAIINSNIQDEFMYMENMYNLSTDQELKILNNSIDGAFTTDEVKNYLRKMI